MRQLVAPNLYISIPCLIVQTLLLTLSNFSPPPPWEVYHLCNIDESIGCFYSRAFASECVLVKTRACEPVFSFRVIEGAPVSVGERRVRLTHSWLTEVGPCLDTSTFILKALVLPRGALSRFDSAPGAEGAQTRKD